MSNQKKRGSTEQDKQFSAHQPNLDQDQHDQWLASLSRVQVSSLASRLGSLARKAEKTGQIKSVFDEYNLPEHGESLTSSGLSVNQEK
jgi:hypothetical protein